MDQGLIPRRYAKALYGFASDKGVTERVYVLMKNLEASFAELPDLQKALSNPFVNGDDKTQLLFTASQASKADSVFADFVKLLIHNRRVDDVRQIALAYLKIYREERNIHVVHVESAAPLAPDEEKRLRRLVERHIGDDAMEFTTGVDPSLIGGFTISVDNERLDASISNELRQLRQNLISK